MKFRFLITGKFSDKNCRSLAELYLQRISHYINCELVFIKPEKIGVQSEKEILQKEGNRILDKITARDYNIVLDRCGDEITSEEFAGLINGLALQSIKEVNFIIGGPLGLSQQVKDRANAMLALSTMTLPHELASVVLLEQVYRGVSILRGEKYHK